MKASEIVRWGGSAACLLYAAILYVAGIRPSESAASVLAYVPTAVGLLAIAVDKYLWKLPFIQRFVPRPHIGGSWLTTIQPSKDSRIPEGGNRGPIEAAVVIEQTLWSLHITLLTGESSSQSVAASIARNGESNERWSVTYVYQNEPKQEHRRRSPVHRGASNLQATGGSPKQMEGTYWTDRFTAGDMTLKLVTRETDFANLQDLLSHARRVGAKT